MYLGRANERCHAGTTQDDKCKRGDHDLYEVYRYNNGQYIVIVLACRYCTYQTTRQEKSQ